MTVRELKEMLKDVDDSLAVIIETAVKENGENVEVNHLAEEIATNDTELYICGYGK